MKLNHVLDTKNLDKMISEGYISKRTHRMFPLAILNYTQKAMWDNVWNNETMWCRGLIYNFESNEIVAMGPKKFFNYGQEGSIEAPLDTKVRVTTKLDGSLGILWHYDNVFGIATRGSFTSDQAIHATKLLNDPKYKYFKEFAVTNPDETLVVEIIYPENKIVVSYGDDDELRLLGGVKHSQGLIEFRERDIVQGPIIPLSEALQLPIPDDEEGYVLDILGSVNDVLGHVKLKGEKYKELHRIMTGISGRKIWEMMLARFIHKTNIQVPSMPGIEMKKLMNLDVSMDILDMLGDVPDEFSEWVKTKIDEINSKVDASIWDDIQLSTTLEHIPDGRERFEAGRHNPHIGAILVYLRTGNPTQIHIEAWKSARPGVELPFRKDEDA